MQKLYSKLLLGLSHLRILCSNRINFLLEVMSALGPLYLSLTDGGFHFFKSVWWSFYTEDALLKQCKAGSKILDRAVYPGLNLSHKFLLGFKYGGGVFVDFTLHIIVNHKLRHSKLSLPTSEGYVVFVLVELYLVPFVSTHVSFHRRYPVI